MITYTRAQSIADLKGILQLQKSNLRAVLSAEEIATEGFVTVHHTLEILTTFNRREQHVIAKDGEQVVGYVLAMTKASRLAIPMLIPMFELFDNIYYKDKLISAYHYLVVGQVCIDKNYRGQGLFDSCYAAYRKYYSDDYDFAITEIATNNLRSRAAHKRVGFEEIHTYTDTDQTEWVIVVWDWQTAENQ